MNNHKMDVLPPRNCDPEVAGIMDELDRLQHWLVMQGANSQGRVAMSAAELVQRTRCLIVERCFNSKPGQ